MTILCWNCRGIGQPRTVQDLVCLVGVHRPKLLFLCETKQRKEKVESLKWRLGLKNVIVHSEQGKGGGVALFWDESVIVDLVKLGSRFINVIVSDLPKE
ncbi:hypothetical protein BRADI_2g04043v3 [Brachypodium distachyon]|uniref:Endonuclease/exonuclease/phosphatase domain-containing protein n=1 Tax=Brachypodium distachyon TaxID=15368 RepID=A0A2K2D6S9_BRADI|nr:hypothetical protein BRADI_2g04043v3 [Brachypodium distachyon]